MRTAGKLIASSLAILAATYSVTAQNITVDCSVTHQIVHGFGTCTIDWRTNPNVIDLYDLPSFQHNYADTMGMSVVRVVVAPEVLFNNGEPVPYDSISYLNPPWDFERNRVRYMWSAGGYYEFAEVDDYFSKAAEVVHWARDIKKIAPHMKFIATPWSPPAWMKRKDWTTLAGEPLAITNDGGVLLPQYYRHYGKFLAEWVKGIKAVYDVDIYAISLQNEPLFTQPYNSCTYTGASASGPGTYYQAFKEVVQVFAEEGLGDMRWFGPEDMTKFPERTFQYVAPILEDPEIAHALSAVAAHGYSDGVQSITDPADDLRLWEFVEQYDKEYWMTETGGGDWLWPDALGGTPSMLHNMMTYGHCSLVAFWQIAGPQVSTHELMDYDQHTKKSYSFMHFSKYIRPEAVRVDTDPIDGENVGASAYYHPVDRTLTVVLLNHATSSKSVTLNFNDFTGTSFEQYRTSGAENFASQADVTVSGATATVQLPAQSVVTLYGTGESQSNPPVAVAQRSAPRPQQGLMHNAAQRGSAVFSLTGRRVNGATNRSTWGIRVMQNPDGSMTMGLGQSIR